MGMKPNESLANTILAPVSYAPAYEGLFNEFPNPASLATDAFYGFALPECPDHPGVQLRVRYDDTTGKLGFACPSESPHWYYPFRCPDHGLNLERVFITDPGGARWVWRCPGLGEEIPSHYQIGSPQADIHVNPAFLYKPIRALIADGQGLYAAEQPYNPSTLLGMVDVPIAVSEDMGLGDTVIEGEEPEEDEIVPGPLTIAALAADTKDSQAEAAAAVDAEERKTRHEHMRALGKLRARMARNGQIWTSHFQSAQLSLASARVQELSEYQQKLAMGSESARKTVLTGVLDRLVSAQQVHASLHQEAARTSLYRDQLVTAIQHDHFMLAVDAKRAEATWDLDLWKYNWRALSVLHGAPLVPRPMTQKERVAAAIMNSASVGMQLGAATGNIALGAGAAVLTLAASLIGMN